MSDQGLITTVAWGLNGKVCYALEGSIFVAGAAIQWLRDEMHLIEKSSDSESMAKEVDDTGGVYVVPAFVGLGTPYWDPHARGVIVGMTRGTGRSHIVRATLESIAYQVTDVLKVMEEESKTKLKTLKVDGGASQNDFLMQFQADMIETQVVRPGDIEATCMGAALMAGITVGFYEEQNLPMDDDVDTYFAPKMAKEEVKAKQKGWQKALQRSFMWEEEL